ncbi:uncharacterized protein LOC125264295 [Megalobrama amblycephala]|uniref:uncharacterized protein LOC125264295 n=1 Tax=Megalobrama amblycephala TaxID=75352 RepID=UPI002013DAC1|nr:uncharacterized protein LOC125264295 [Megalobrama amblycephala]
MEHLLPLHEDNKALLNYERTHPEERSVTDRPLQEDQTESQPVRMDDSQCFDAGDVFLMPETPAESQLKLMRSMQPSQTSVRSPQTLRSLQYEELEESRQWFRPAFDSEDPGRSQNLHFPTSIHQSDPQEELNHIPQDCQPPSTPINIKPVTVFTHINPFHAPHLNPSWPVLVPHFNPVASAPHQNPFCPIYTPPLHFDPNRTTLVACGDSTVSCLVLPLHMNVYPVYPTPYLPSNTQSPSQASLSGDSSARWFPEDVCDSYGLWRRLRETARGFSSGSPDTEALACFFMHVIRSFAVHSPDLPFTDAVNVAVQEWRKISNFEREQYYINARMFIELEDQVKSANRADEDQSIPAQTGNVKKTRKRSNKVAQERPVQDLAESALTEYSQVMDALESKVSGGSEVTAAVEEDVCALYLNELFNHSEFTTEAAVDVDYISSLLSADHNLTDDLKENSQDVFSGIIPEPVAGCSDWIDTTVSEAQVLPSSALQCDFSTNLQNHMMQNVFQMSTPPELVWLQDNIMENDGQNAFQTLTEVQSSDQSVSVQETIHSALQDFQGPEADGNSSGQKDKTSYNVELDSTIQSNSLQNYKSHHATFTHSIKHPKTPLDSGMEHNGEENMVVGQKTVKSTKEKGNIDSDIPNNSQRVRNNATETQTNIKEMPEEKNGNGNKKQIRQRRRRKQRKITALDERTTSKPGDKDGRRSKTDQRHRKTQDGQQRSATSTKHEIMVEREQRTDVTETRSSATDGRRGNLRQHDGQKTGENLHNELERRQRPIKTGRSHEANKERKRMMEAERNNGKTYRRAENGRLKKQQKLAIVGNGDFQSHESFTYTRRSQNSYKRQTKKVEKVQKQNKVDGHNGKPT